MSIITYTSLRRQQAIYWFCFGLYCLSCLLLRGVPKTWPHDHTDDRTAKLRRMIAHSYDVKTWKLSLTRTPDPIRPTRRAKLQLEVHSVERMYLRQSCSHGSRWIQEAQLSQRGRAMPRVVEYFVSPGDAPVAITQCVAWMKRQFNACQTHRSTYPSIFNIFPVIRTASAKNRHFTYRSPHFCFPWRRPCDYHTICCMDGKTIQCLPNPSQYVPIYLQ